MSELQRPYDRLSVATRRSPDLAMGSPSAQVNDAAHQTSTVFLMIWRRRWIVVVFAILGVIGGIIALSRAPKIYGADSSILITQSAPKFITDTYGQGVTTPTFLYSQCQVITSTKIIHSALEKQGVSDASCLAGAENPVALVKMMLSATPAKNGDIINVHAETAKPEDAAIMVNGVVDAYIADQSSQHQSTAREVLTLYGKEMQERVADLEQVQQDLATLKKNNPELTFQTDHGNLILNDLAVNSSTLIDAQLKQLDLKTAMAEAEGAKTDPWELRRIIRKFDLSDPGDTVVSPELMNEYAASRILLDKELNELGSEHYQVRSTSNVVDQLSKAIQQATASAANNYMQALRQAMSMTDARVKALQEKVDLAKEKAGSLNNASAQGQLLMDKAQSIQREIDSLDSRMKEVHVTEDVSAMNISVLETAHPSSINQPIFPVPSTMVGKGLLAGLVLGVCGAMLRDVMDHRIRSADEIAGLLQVPVLGTVPHIAGKLKPTERGRETHLKPRSDVAEAYRTIRTAIFFGLADNKSAKTILVTSPVPGDGKSTVASNLAIAMAQSGRRVLLIDCDCRRPMQSKIYDAVESVGLSNVLIEGLPIEKALAKSGVENLDLLPCGPLPPNPAELLNSQVFLDLIKRAGATYDQIIIDSPPVIPVTDARILAAHCDATVLVLRAEKSTRRMAEAARDALTSVGGILLGVVVNDVTRGAESYGYYYYGYYGYGRHPGAASIPGVTPARPALGPVVVGQSRLEG